MNVGHLRKIKEEREEKLQVDLESLEKMREEREVKLQIE